jgi:hypothetical protein
MLQKEPAFLNVTDVAQVQNLLALVLDQPFAAAIVTKSFHDRPPQKTDQEVAKCEE